MVNKRNRTQAELTIFPLRLSINYNYPAGIFRVKSTIAPYRQKFSNPISAINLNKLESGNLFLYTDYKLYDTVLVKIYTVQFFSDTVIGKLNTEQFFSDTIIWKFNTLQFFSDTVIEQNYNDQIFFNTVVDIKYTDQIFNSGIGVKMIKKQKNVNNQTKLKYYNQTFSICYNASRYKLTILRCTEMHTYKSNIG